MSRQLALQAIIKTLEDRVAALKHQKTQETAKLTNKLQQSETKILTILQQLSECKSIIAKMDQQKKSQQEQSLANIKRKGQQVQQIIMKLNDQHNEQIIQQQFKHQTAVDELKAINYRQLEEHQRLILKLQQSQDATHKLSQKLSELATNQHRVGLQIGRLNNFYKSAIFEIPKRKQTLAWVDKLIEYMECSHTDNVMGKLITQLLEGLKREAKEVLNHQARVTVEVARTDKEINDQSCQVIKGCENAINEFSQTVKDCISQNQQFWILAKENAKEEQKHQSEEQTSELTRLRKTVQQDEERYTKRIKQLENDNRILMLAVQSLKPLLDKRDEQHRGEIVQLKEKLAAILLYDEERQRQYNEELTRLNSELHMLSEKHYQTMDVPASRIRSRLDSSLQSIKSQYQQLDANSQIKQAMHSLEQVIVRYLQSVQGRDGGSYHRELRDLIQKQTKCLEDISRQTHSAHIPEYRDSDKIMKYEYELNLLKKHNAKLQQYCLNLEKRIPSKTPSHSDLPSQQSLMKEVIRLNSQNQALVVYNNTLNEMLQNQPNSNPSQYEKPLNQIAIELSKVLSRVQASEKVFEDIALNISHLNSIMIGPMQSLEEFVKGVDLNSSRAETFLNASTTIVKPPVTQRDVQGYLQILNHKENTAQVFSRAINDMLKTFREYHRGSNTGGDRSPLKALKGLANLVVEQSELKPKMKPAEKRLKELQTQRIRDRQEMTAKVEKLMRQVQTLTNKSSKRQKHPNSNTVETVFMRRISEMEAKIQEKLKAITPISRVSIDAFKDVQTKLQQCLLENEGLVKQLSVLHAQRGRFQ